MPDTPDAPDVVVVLQQANVRLRAENAELKAQVAELEERVAWLERLIPRNSGNSSMPPSTDDLPGKKPAPWARRRATVSLMSSTANMTLCRPSVLGGGFSGPAPAAAGVWYLVSSSLVWPSGVRIDLGAGNQAERDGVAEQQVELAQWHCHQPFQRAAGPFALGGDRGDDEHDHKRENPGELGGEPVQRHWVVQHVPQQDHQYGGDQFSLDNSQSYAHWLGQRPA